MSAEKPRVTLEPQSAYSEGVQQTAEVLEEAEAQELVIELARHTDRLERFEIYHPHDEIGVHLRLRNENGVGGAPYELAEFLDRRGWRIASTGQDDELGCTFVEVVKK